MRVFAPFLGYFAHFLDKAGRNLFYATSEGLFKVNIASRLGTKIITSCPKALYVDYCISPFDGKIMACRIDTKVLDKTIQYTERNIFEFDNDGSNMKMIEIP